MTHNIPEPEITHLGTTSGEWPVIAFVGEDQAKHWATTGPSDRTRYLWPVEEIRLGSPCRVEQKREFVLKEVGS